MSPENFMIIAGEPSGDMLAAELVRALCRTARIAEMPFPPRFFGAGGSQMAAAGVELAVDMTQHAVFGLSDVLRHYRTFKRIFRRLFELALEREPKIIILVDYSGFNRRFAKAIKQCSRRRSGPFQDWNPKIVYYVSPQVWASRESRAYQLARDVDLLLSIFPFEKEWYAARVPKLRVQFVGHPLVDRYAHARRTPQDAGEGTATMDSETVAPISSAVPLVLLLPGSRKREVEAHLPVMAEALGRIRRHTSVRLRLVLPNSDLVQVALSIIQPIPDLEIRTTGLADSLREAQLAIASSGTVTLECAFFRVPTVVIYKTSWLTYVIARQIVKVRHIAMPNILADERIFPELIQHHATADRIAQESLRVLTNPAEQREVRSKLTHVIRSLGNSGANVRAAEAIVELL